MRRDKMLEAYKVCIDVDGACYDCPYYLDEHIDPEDCDRKVLKDVLELLKQLQNDGLKHYDDGSSEP